MISFYSAERFGDTAVCPNCTSNARYLRTGSTAVEIYRARAPRRENHAGDHWPGQRGNLFTVPLGAAIAYSKRIRCPTGRANSRRLARIPPIYCRRDLRRDSRAGTSRGGSKFYVHSRCIHSSRGKHYSTKDYVNINSR